MLQLARLNPFAAAWLALAFLFCEALAGCAAKPVTAEDYVQTAKAQLAAGYRSLGDLKAAGLVTQEEGRSYFSRLERAEESGVRPAERSLAAGQLSTAQGQAQAATALLLEIDRELRARLATKKGT